MFILYITFGNKIDYSNGLIIVEGFFFKFFDILNDERIGSYYLEEFSKIYLIKRRVLKVLNKGKKSSIMRKERVFTSIELHECIPTIV